MNVQKFVTCKAKFVFAIFLVVGSQALASGSHPACAKLFKPSSDPLRELLVNETRAWLTKATDPQSSDAVKGRVWGARNFMEMRTWADVTFWIKPYLQLLPSNCRIISLGSGVGLEIATAIKGDSAVPAGFLPHLMSNSKTGPGDLELAKGRQFIGITATPESDLLIEKQGPQHKIFAGRLFEDIPDQELRDAIGDQPVLAFSNVGLLDYTLSPDQVLEKIHNTFPIGSIIVNKNSGPHGEFHHFYNAKDFNSPIGGITDYAALMGFEKLSDNAFRVTGRFKPAPIKLLTQHPSLPSINFYLLLDSSASKQEMHDFETSFVERWVLEDPWIYHR